ncbi:helix-turn-helix domain-containing protein [Phyllobacterium sp. SYP-B3895]|uniref:helix-turn-helix domain-containing protein n=1 Tax=Phyllobacterium sp. SYP-B3895 TaxID=2663240 RepID=UPI0012998311|nr:helix-turn-helix transcriptional regulator [Phyllobacterium sp. SYP-B3895]MRG55701.1 helix-turn-helix domain-containing protein [Phyllobacterium sp. SYP-B3895]
MNDPRTVFANIRRLQKFDMTLAEIARACRTHRSTLDRVLRGQRFSDPPQDVIQRLADLVAEKTRASH